jgi:polyisoprenoid-binding protein YceI
MRLVYFFYVSIILFFGISLTTLGQRYVTKNGVVVLKYNAPHGKMETENRHVAAAYNASTGEMQFNIVMLSFRFAGAYSQQKFDEYFKKNAHFANSIFKGRIVDFEKIDLNKNGTYEVQVTGNFTLRQVTKEIKAKAKFTVNSGTISGKSTFIVNLMDFNFNIPPSMEKTIRVEVDTQLQKIK